MGCEVMMGRNLEGKEQTGEETKGYGEEGTKYLWLDGGLTEVSRGECINYFPSIIKGDRKEI